MAITLLKDEIQKSIDLADEFVLSHYGVKGMKWGVRRTAKQREAASEDAARVGSIHSRVSSQKSTKMLSNKELQDAITRMNLEQQYSRLTGGLEKTRMQKGAAMIRDMMQSTLKTNVQTAVNGQVKDVMDKKLEQGKYSPEAVAEREAKAKKRQQQG